MPPLRRKVIITAPIVGSGGRPGCSGSQAAAPEMLSILEEAAQLWVARCSEKEQGWVPRRELESRLCLMQRFVIEVASASGAASVRSVTCRHHAV